MKNQKKPKRIRMLTTVGPEPQFKITQLHAIRGNEYNVKVSKQGKVVVLLPHNQILHVRDGEYEVMEWAK